MIKLLLHRYNTKNHFFCTQKQTNVFVNGIRCDMHASFNILKVVKK